MADTIEGEELVEAPGNGGPVGGRAEVDAECETATDNAGPGSSWGMGYSSTDARFLLRRARIALSTLSKRRLVFRVTSSQCLLWFTSAPLDVSARSQTSQM